MLHIDVIVEEVHNERLNRIGVEDKLSSEDEEWMNLLSTLYIYIYRSI